MIAIEYIRNNFEKVELGLKSKGCKENLSEILLIDKKYREGLSVVNDLRAKRNKVSDQISELKKNKQDAADKISSMRAVGEQIKEIETSLSEKKDILDSLILNLPNIPHETVPRGATENDNKVIEEWGDEIQKNFKLKTHLDLGSNLNLFDFERSAKISGSGFPLYTGKGALLERSLINFMLEFQTLKNHYVEIIPPYIVKSNSVLTTGNLPKFSEDMYHSELDDLWLIPTAEVPLTSIHSNEILQESDLPKKYVAYSPCFRREAGSYGKDTKGFQRLHQFNKVELVQLVKPEDSFDALEALTGHAEVILQKLELPYRKVLLCTGDMGFGACKTYDLEVWLPAQNTYREISSCSNMLDFQARRMQARFRNPKTNKPELLHTLNGSGLAVGRTLVAILENNQQADGSVTVPKALVPYMNGQERISAN